ncbi:MAG: hypothetical protein LBT05_14945 [Planctomycetaceae bacterium]|jgi:hypothetical protein|nr:hypothetical protein [Planctomycetaceae bacterium]
MPDFLYFSKQENRYDVNLMRTRRHAVTFDSLQDLHVEKASGIYDRKAFQRNIAAGRFSIDGLSARLLLNNSFHVCAMNLVSLAGSWNVFNVVGKSYCTFRFDERILQKHSLSSIFNAVDFWTPPRRSAFHWNYEERVALKEHRRFRFDSRNLAGRGKSSFAYRVLISQRSNVPFYWNVIPCEFRAKAFLFFDGIFRETAMIPLRKQALVRSGWRIMTRNILTNEETELGFIDANDENKSLEDVFLPDGDYEIFVLTSSLFWNDTSDRNILQLAVRPDSEILPLPMIYNLRSSVSQGIATIEWSANPSDVNDCVFGLWFASESPVDTKRPPDKTLWYYPAQSEYKTTFQQNAPASLAIAVLRTGNELERGKVHELFLDWSNAPPHAPDDVVVINPQKL